MTTTDEVLRNATQAVFSVCADESVIAAATAASVLVPGSVFAGEFHDYITPDRRPQFSTFLTEVASCVALIDYDKDLALAVETSKRLRQIFLKKISIIAYGQGADASDVLRAMRSGCSEYLAKPVGEAEIVQALRRFQENQPAPGLQQKGVGRVIAFFGAKGGVGTTALVVHLASHLVRLHGKKTLLIDHKHQLGHVALYLGLKDTAYHFDELLLNHDRLDRDLLGGFLARHISGLEVIASPEVAQGIHRSSRDELERVIGFLRREYDYVLLDSSLLYQESAVMLLDQADEVYLISTPDVAALRDLARLVESLHMNEPGKLHLVINRSTAEDSIKSDQIESAIRFPITVSIPNNYFELLAAINAGEPISPQGRSEFNAKLAQWCNQIVYGGGVPAPAPRKKKGFALWR
jgi:pilus assembly protein CpaE